MLVRFLSDGTELYVFVCLGFGVVVMTMSRFHDSVFRKGHGVFEFTKHMFGLAIITGEKLGGSVLFVHGRGSLALICR